MEITTLTERDLAPLAELFKQFWGENSSLERMRHTFSKITSNPAYVLLAAKQENQLIGFVMGIICEELYGDCKPFMVIEDLVVDQNQRRSGAGSSLMQEIEQHAVANGCCQILLVTEGDRLESNQFYQSLGYNFEPYKGYKKKIDNHQQIKR